MGRIRNTHERTINASATRLGELLESLGSASDRLWPSPAWSPMRLDRPLAVGADGGHSGIRYRVSEHIPGSRARFTFHPGSGFEGFHEFSVTPLDPERVLVRHVAEGSSRGPMRLLWPTVVRPVHDAVLEDLLDNAEREATGSVASPARWSTLVRLLRRLDPPTTKLSTTPATTPLLRDALPRVDHSDAISVAVQPGTDTDPQAWVDAVFHDPPRWVVALLGLRQAVVGLVGIARDDGHAFDTVARTDDEVLVGTDEGHLDFRASMRVQDGVATLTTVVQIHNWRGRLYWSVVRHAHPVVVRTMLRRAARTLADRAWAGRLTR